VIRRLAQGLPWTNITLVAVGAMIVIVTGPLLMISTGIWQDWLDAVNPVATAKVAMSERVDPETLRLQLWVTRQRNCETLKMIGLTGPDAKQMQGATVMRREDNEPPLSYPVGVTILSRPWLLSPVYGNHLWIYGYYDCDGRVVKQRIVDEVLP